MKSTTTILLLFCSFVIAAQSISERIPTLIESKNLYQHEEKFRDWLFQQPKETRGWKWMARYEHELLRRIDTAGNMPSSDFLLSANENIENLR